MYFYPERGQGETQQDRDRYEKTTINFLGFVACLRMWLA